MIALNPCPFCGDRGVYRRGGDSRDPRFWVAGCPNGHAESPEMETQEQAAAWWNRRNTEVSPPPFDPMQGCSHCTWLDTNLGRVLDQKCELHQKIEDLQSDLSITDQVHQDTARMLTKVCESLGADEDDDPVRIAQERMDEIKAFEDELDAKPALQPSGARVKQLEWDGYIATTPFGSYTITERNDGEWEWTFHCYPFGTPDDTSHATEDAARAAAHADYERRILSALEDNTAMAYELADTMLKEREK